MGDMNFTVFIERFSSVFHELSAGGIMCEFEHAIFLCLSLMHDIKTEHTISLFALVRDTLDVDSRHYSMFNTGQNGLNNLYRGRCKGCETFIDAHANMSSPTNSV